MGRVVVLSCLVAVGGCHMFVRTGAQERGRESIPGDGPHAGRPPESTPDPLGGGQKRSSVPTEPKPPVVKAQPVVREKGTASIGPADAPAAPDPLEQAADCLDRGDSVGATRHLARHVDRYPDQVLFRLQLAELLYDQERFADAGRHFEAAVGYVQDGSPAVRRHLIHCHTRLMEVARETADAYAERLHRGIGLYLVGVQLTDRAEAAEVERLLCKAAAELKEAQAVRPADARVAWYLYRVWVKLDQPRPAGRALREARAAAPFSDLTAAEARDLALVR